MKITIDELDLNLQNKIKQLDNVATQSEFPTYIAYENGKFVNKNINAYNVNKAISSDEIFELSKHLYKTEDNYISGYDNILVGNDNSYSTSTLLTTLYGDFAFKVDSKIIMIKFYSAFIIVLCENGYVYKINKSDNTIINKNAYDIILNNFIPNNFNIYDITDIDYYSDGVLLSTENHGIIFISLEREESSMVCDELYISNICVLEDRKTLLITKHNEKNNIVLFNLETGIKLSSYYHMGIKNQISNSIATGTNEFFILGKTYAVNQDDHLLHYWKLDKANIDYENCDRSVANNKCDNLYNPKFIKNYESSICIMGTKGKDLFLWEYDKKNLKDKPLELLYKLQDVEYDDLKDFIFLNNRFYIAIKNRILVLDMSFNLLENYLLNGKSEFSFANVCSDGIYVVYDKECYRFTIPEKVYNNITDITILSSKDPICNNIDIMVKAPSNTVLTFISGEEKITPYYYIKMDNKIHIIKLFNTNKNNIIMKANVTDETGKINAIVVHKNRLFFKE